jgi:hypothetical protein
LQTPAGLAEQREGTPMKVTRKINHITFEHDDEFKGEVTITRGEATLAVPMVALRAIVAESVRHELTATIQKMQPADLLRRIA